MLYDILRKDSKHMPDCPVFEITNVAQFVEEAKNWREWGEEELSKIQDAFPPYDMFFMEFDAVRRPRNGYSEEHSKIGHLWNTKKTENGWDCEVALVEGYKDGSFTVTTEKTNMCGKTVKEAGFSSPHEAHKAGVKLPKTGLGAYACGRDAGLPMEPKYFLKFSIDNNGRPIGGVDDFKIDRLRTLEIIPNFHAMMFMAMSSRCVAVEDNPPARAFRKRHEQKGDYLPVTFKVLVIKGMGQKREPSEEGDDSQKRLHICRGHKMRATADRPLFGKTWGVGTFWIAGHTRGRKELGTAEKIYEVSTEVA